MLYARRKARRDGGGKTGAEPEAIKEAEGSSDDETAIILPYDEEEGCRDARVKKNSRTKQPGKSKTKAAGRKSRKP